MKGKRKDLDEEEVESGPGKSRCVRFHVGLEESPFGLLLLIWTGDGNNFPEEVGLLVICIAHTHFHLLSSHLLTRTHVTLIRQFNNWTVATMSD